jgi:hypothetical protein
MLSPFSVIAALFLLAESKYITNPQPVCKDVRLSLTATAENFALPSYPNSTTRTTVGQYLSSFNASTIQKNRTVSGTFTIAATYCEPANKVSERENSIQLLLHGIGYTKVGTKLVFPPLHVLIIFARNIGRASGIQTPAIKANTPGSAARLLRATQRLPSTTSETDSPTIPIQFPSSSFLYKSNSYANSCALSALVK